MKNTVDPKNPPQREELSTQQLRQKLAAHLQSMSDENFEDWMMNEGIGLNQLARLWPAGKVELSGGNGNYVLTDWHPEPAEAAK